MRGFRRNPLGCLRFLRIGRPRPHVGRPVPGTASLRFIVACRIDPSGNDGVAHSDFRVRGCNQRCSQIIQGSITGDGSHQMGNDIEGGRPGSHIRNLLSSNPRSRKGHRRDHGSDDGHRKRYNHPRSPVECVLPDQYDHRNTRFGDARGCRRRYSLLIPFRIGPGPDDHGPSRQHMRTHGHNIHQT